MTAPTKPTCEKFVEGADPKPYICATCGEEQHLHPGACDHCGGHRTAPDGWALRQGFTPCPFCAPATDKGLDFEKARQAAKDYDESHDDGSGTMTEEEAYRAALQAQHLAALEGVRKEEREKASRDTARLDYLERQTTEEQRCVNLQGSPPQGLRPTFAWIVHRNGIGYMPWAETVREAIDKAMEAE